MIFEPYDVLVVPFPFTDSSAVKMRPVVVLSARPFNDRAGHLVLAMITSRENRGWPLDVEVADLASAGLTHPSVVRMKIFTLDERLVRRKAGRLAEGDRAQVAQALQRLLPTANRPTRT